MVKDFNEKNRILFETYDTVVRKAYHEFLLLMENKEVFGFMENLSNFAWFNDMLIRKSTEIKEVGYANAKSAFKVIDPFTKSQLYYINYKNRKCFNALSLWLFIQYSTKECEVNKYKFKGYEIVEYKFKGGV